MNHFRRREGCVVWARSTRFMIARIALWEPPTTAIVTASSRGSTSARRLGLRTVSRPSSLRFVEVTDGHGEGRDFGDEPVQRIRRGVET